MWCLKISVWNHIKAKTVFSKQRNKPYIYTEQYEALQKHETLCSNNTKRVASLAFATVHTTQLSSLRSELGIVICTAKVPWTKGGEHHGTLLFKDELQSYSLVHLMWSYCMFLCLVRRTVTSYLAILESRMKTGLKVFKDSLIICSLKHHLGWFEWSSFWSLVMIGFHCDCTCEFIKICFFQLLECHLFLTPNNTETIKDHSQPITAEHMLYSLIQYGTALIKICFGVSLLQVL